MDEKIYGGMMLGVVGFAFLAWIDWQIALCLFVIFWGHNLERNH